MDSFYVTLPSDSSRDLYPANGPSKYTTKLKQSASLVGDYEVALMEIQYKFDFDNFTTIEGTPSFYITLSKEDFDHLVVVDSKYFEPLVYDTTESAIAENIAQLRNLMDRISAIGDTVLLPHLKKDDSPYDVWITPKIAARQSIEQAISKYSKTTTSVSIDRWIEGVVYAINAPYNLNKNIITYLQPLMPSDDEVFTKLSEINNMIQQLISSFWYLLGVDSSIRQKRDVPNAQPLMAASESLTNALGITGPSDKLMTDQLKGVLREAEKQTRKLAELTDAIAAMPFQSDLANVPKSTAVYSVVPIALIPYEMIDRHRRFKIPVTFPSGYYKDPPALVQAINWHLKHSCIVRNLNQFVHFSYDPVTTKITMHINAATSVVDLARDFSQQIGFAYSYDFVANGVVTGQFPVRFYEHWQLMYIYSDVVDFSFVGHSMAQLLRVLPTDGEVNTYTVVRFDSPHFMPVLKSDVSTLEVELLNEYGEPFRIKSGKTIIKLKFQPRVKHIF